MNVIETKMKHDERERIRETSNTQDVTIAQVAGAVAILLAVFGGPLLGVELKTASELATLGNSVVCQPLSSYFSSEHQAAREKMQSIQQGITSDLDLRKQECTSHEQRWAELMRQLDDTRGRRASLIGEMWR